MAEVAAEAATKVAISSLTMLAVVAAARRHSNGSSSRRQPSSRRMTAVEALAGEVAATGATIEGVSAGSGCKAMFSCCMSSTMRMLWMPASDPGFLPCFGAPDPADLDLSRAVDVVLQWLNPVVHLHCRTGAWSWPGPCVPEIQRPRRSPVLEVTQGPRGPSDSSSVGSCHQPGTHEDEEAGAAASALQVNPRSATMSALAATLLSDTRD